jgi:glycosyltransferase involved in cell wall biosynthesis
MTETPRVLQIFNRYRLHGGEETIIENMTPLLRDIADVTDCLFESQSWVGPNAPPRWRQALLSLYNPDSAHHALELHREKRSQIWLTHNLLPVGSPSIYRTALRHRIPLIQHVQNYRPFSITGTYWIGNALVGPTLRPALFREALHGAWNGSIPQGLVMAAAMRLLLASGWLDAVKAWVGVSRATCAHLKEAGIPGSRIHHIPPVWTRSAATSEIRPRYDGGFLYLGRLIPEKGIPTLLAAWKNLREDHGDAAPRLIICGAGPMEPAVRAAAGANPAIRFAGLVGGTEKQNLLARCTALVVPSLWWDPNPTVVGEAYNHAKPVLAAATGGLLDTVRESETGFLHAPGAAADLATHVRHLAADAALAKRMGQNGLVLMEELCRVDRWKAAFREVIEKTLDQR